MCGVVWALLTTAHARAVAWMGTSFTEARQKHGNQLQGADLVSSSVAGRY